MEESHVTKTHIEEGYVNSWGWFIASNSKIGPKVTNPLFVDQNVNLPLGFTYDLREEVKTGIMREFLQYV